MEIYWKKFHSKTKIEWLRVEFFFFSSWMKVPRIFRSILNDFIGPPGSGLQFLEQSHPVLEIFGRQILQLGRQGNKPALLVNAILG